MILYEDKDVVVYHDPDMPNYKGIRIRNKRRNGVEVEVDLDPENLSHLLIHAVKGQMRVEVISCEDGVPGVRIAPGR